MRRAVPDEKGWRMSVQEEDMVLSVCREVASLHDYADRMLKEGRNVITAEKTAKIFVRRGVPGEEVVSWSEDSCGQPLIETVSVIEDADAWVAAKADEEGQVLVDENGHENRWVLSDETLREKYRPDPKRPGIYIPAGDKQRFLELTEAVRTVRGGQQWRADAGGYINITDPDDMYLISGRDFADTYRIIPSSTQT